MIPLIIVCTLCVAFLALVLCGIVYFFSTADSRRADRIRREREHPERGEYATTRTVPRHRR